MRLQNNLLTETGRKGFRFPGDLAREKREKQNAYKVLGLQPTASTNEIKHAYKNLSLKWCVVFVLRPTLDRHPDKNPGDEKAKDRYYKIREAYDLLIKKQK